jgi:hypothetical protein
VFSIFNIKQWDGFGELQGCTKPIITNSSAQSVEGSGCQFKDGAAVLAYWNIESDDDLRFLAILIGHMVVCRVLAFFALNRRLKIGMSTGANRSASTAKAGP